MHHQYLSVGLLISFLSISFSTTAQQVSANAEQLKAQVSKAISYIMVTPREQWSVKVVNYENEEGDIASSIEHYIANEQLEKKWRLLKLNGNEPTQKQQNDYLEEKLKHEEQKSQGKSHSLNLNKLIQANSLRLKANLSSHAEFSFQVTMKKLGDDAKGKLSGVLSYNKHHDFVEKITITNNAEFSPVFSANITDIELTFEFIKINDAVLPMQQALNMKGTFAFFTEIDEVSTTTFSDYQHKATTTMSN